jgi:hypothetical protein
MSLNSNINIPAVQPVPIVPTNPTSLTSDETYLESFIEHIQTLPSEIRRNLDLMKDLDSTCSTKLQQMAEYQKLYIQRIETKLDGLEVVDGKGVRIPKRKNKEDETSKKSSSSKKNTKKNKSIEDDKDDDDDEDGDYIVIPTTEEFLRYIHQNDDNEEEDSSSDKIVSLSQIKATQQDCLQQAEEKVMIAKQTHRLVDNICRRLDIDIQHMEKLLLQTGEFQNLPGIAKPNDLAAIQAPGSTDWILAKVISHDPTTGMYKLSDEDVESNKSKFLQCLLFFIVF